MFQRLPRSLLGLVGCAVALLSISAPADAHRRLHHRHAHLDRYRERVLLVEPVIVVAPGLLPGTYPADYGTPGYGARSSAVNGNFGGYGRGWTYEGGPGWGYR